jgi:hypothetical protein
MRKPSQTPVLDIATKATKCGTATTRFSITREQAQELRRIEADAGHGAGLRYVLRLLAERRS